jgi:hypothetical protein
VPEHDDSENDEQPGHPTDNVLAAYLDDHLAPEERSEVEAHLEGCAECRHAIADTVDVIDGGDGVPADRRPSRLSLVTPASRRRSVTAWTVVGAALAASIAGIALLRTDARTRADVEAPSADQRFGGSDERIRDLVAIEPAGDAVNVGARPTFVWRPVEGADRYSFRLLGDDGATIWSRDVSDTSLVLPADVALARGRSYFWRVDAMSAGILASTRARRFTTAP